MNSNKWPTCNCFKCALKGPCHGDDYEGHCRAIKCLEFVPKRIPVKKEHKR